MGKTFPRSTAVLTALGAVGLVFGAPSAVYASQDPLQHRIDAVLAQFPGGTQVASNEIEWEAGTIVLTLSAPENARAAAGTCPSGAYCAYSGYTFSGSKLTLWSCDTTTSIAPLGVVRSLENERSTGNVKAKNAADTVLATVNHGASLGYAPSGITKLSCTS